MDPKKSSLQAVNHETTDARPKPLVIFGIGLFVLCVVSFAAMAWLFKVGYPSRERADEPVKPYYLGPLLNVGDQVQVMDLKEHRAWEAAELSKFAWIDKGEGKAQIPIERAMELVLKKGLPEKTS